MQMLKRKSKTMFFAALIVSLVVSLLLPAVISTSYAASTNVIKPVYITSKSYVKLESADIIPSSKGTTASFTVTFYNGDAAAINLQDYWARLSSTAGSKYTLQLVESDKTKKTVPSKTSVTLTYYSDIASNVPLSNLILKVIKFDFSVAGYERAVANFKFPSTYTNDVKVNGFKPVKMNGTNVNMRVNKSIISAGSKNNEINIELVMRNTGQFTVSLSNFNFYIQASNGAIYKLESNTESGQSITLRPQILETLKLNVELPVSIKTSGMKLIAAQSFGEAASLVNVPVAKFQLGLKAPSNNGSSAVKYEYINGDNSYEIQMNSIEKTPWKSNDNIVGVLSITNKGAKSAPLPNITGAFFVDDSVEVDTTLIPLSKEIVIGAKSTVTAYYYSSVPSTLNTSNLEFKLYEVEGEKKTELADLKTSTSTTPANIAIGSTFEIKEYGENATAQVTDVRVYEGQNNNLYTIYMDVTNNQNKPLATLNLAGYLQTASNNVFDTKITKTTNTINTGKKEQIIVTAEVPKNTDLTGANLVLGLAFNDKGLVKSNEADVLGFVKSAKFSLPEDVKATTLLSDIKVGPYTINFTSIIAHLDGEFIKLDLNSTVARDANYDGFTNKKFTIALEDESTNIKMLELPFEIDAATGNYVWKSDSSNYTRINEDMTNKLVSKTFTLNIYEEINGYKKKLVSKNITWSPYFNWADPNVTY
ncbi:hypothetical protein [Paenibacillus harenae]|uniref:hypothetical protein n=1 Tax=Paenibacillus harenae TaxID=306543 RepID=UPI0012EBF165|nr:hypothetical protein [Paenibacillus harenae]